RTSPSAPQRDACELDSSLDAVLIERFRQFVRDLLRSASFDLPALEDLHDFAIAHERDRRRRRTISGEVRASTRRRFGVVAGEDGDHLFGQYRVTQRERDAGTRHSSRASADGIDDDEYGSLFLAEDRVDFGGGTRLLDAEAGQFSAHRLANILFVLVCVYIP